MKTIKINLFKFNELNEEAKQVAIENYKNTVTEYCFADEAIKSLEKFAEHFNSKLKNWSIDFFNYSPSFATFSEVEEIEENELKELIMQMGEFNPETLRGLGDCKFTGVCFDEEAADGARKAFFNGERNVNEILQAGFDSWINSVNKDAEYQISDEAVSETLKANEYDFTEDGEIY